MRSDTVFSHQSPVKITLKHDLNDTHFLVYQAVERETLQCRTPFQNQLIKKEQKPGLYTVA